MKIFKLLPVFFILAFAGCQGGFIEPGLVDMPGYNSGGGGLPPSGGGGGGGGGSGPAPTGVTATVNSPSSITVSWNAVEGYASGYFVYLYYSSNAANDDYKERRSTTLSTEVTFTGLSGGTAYYFMVRANYPLDGGEGKFSSRVSATTEPGPPGTPTGLSASGISLSGISLSWNEVPGAQGYYIDYSTNSSFTASTTINADSTNYTVTGLLANTLYYFRVRAYNTEGSSGNSSSVNTTTWYTIPGVASQLTVNQWTDGNITTASGEEWYKFDVTAGTAYYVWWNDRYEGNNTKTGDIQASAYYSTGEPIFSSVDSGWTTPRSFTAASNTTVYIRANPFNNNSSNIGTYGITYAAANTRPLSGFIPKETAIELVAGQWTNGTISGAPNEVWYKFTATASNHYLWWNDSNSGNGNGTITLDVYVSAFRVNETSLLSNSDSGWFSGNNISSLTAGETIYVRVTPKSAGGTGTFGIVFNNANTRPFIMPASPATLTSGTWVDGSIASGTGGEMWYTINAAGGQTYYLWWNDSSQGNGLKTSNVYVTVFSNDGTALMPSADSGWNTPQPFIPTSSGNVYIRVSVNSNSTGTFGIAYNIVNTKPDVPPPSATGLTVDQWISGNILAAGGEQWFSFTATAATQYIHFTVGTLSSINIQLYDSNVNSVGSQTNLNNTTRNINRSVTEGQTYYIRVRSTSPTGNGTYQIAFNDSSTAPAE